MLKEAREFFTGGQRIRESRDTIQRLQAKSRLSNRERDKLTQARGISRRHFLKLSSAGIGVAIVGGITSGLINRVVSSDGQNETDSNLEAETIRQKIREFETQNYGVVNEETTKPLSQFISDLYKATFKREPAQKNVLVIANSYLKESGLPEEKVPVGEAGIVYYEPGTNGEFKNSVIPVIIYAGKPETNDPAINKLSVFRALIEHEFSHAQTKVTQETESITLADHTFRADRRRGFKWINVTFDNGVRKEEFCHFFDEINTQLLAEYLNDPTNQDPIFRQMNASPVFQKSLATTYVEGARHLRTIYQNLGISINVLEELHYEAQPKKLLDLIDQRVQGLGIMLAEPASVTLANLDPQNGDDPAQISSIEDLAYAITKQLARNYN